jgi:hypothetical protein
VCQVGQKEAIMNYHEMSKDGSINYRKSGLVLAGILVMIYLLLLFRGKQVPFVLVFAAITFVGAWFEIWPLRKIVDLLIRIGNVMHLFTNPVVFGLVYVVAVMPTALFLKLSGKDNLGLRFDPNSSTYWVVRRPGTPWRESFRYQF